MRGQIRSWSRSVHLQRGPAGGVGGRSRSRDVARAAAYAVEAMEARVLLSAVTFTATGQAGVASSLAGFETALGGANNGAAAPAATGFRAINWDDVPDGLAAPNNLPADYFNSNSPRGAVLSTPATGGSTGAGFQVSANPTNPTATPTTFGNININYNGAFAYFSPRRLFTPIGGNVTDVTFKVPGTNADATVSGFGAIFSDVDAANTTSLQLFDDHGVSLGTFFATPANNDVSFVGVTFTAGERVSRVRITNGNTPPSATASDLGAAQDVVVNDDFAYGEPQASAAQNFVVTNTADSGAGSLRGAITAANNKGGADSISFNITGGGPQTILPLSALPAITDAVTIDATTEPGFAGVPLVTLTGGAAGGAANGLSVSGVAASGTSIRGLTVVRFAGNQVNVQDANDVVIAGNYLGTDGTANLGSSGAGLLVQGNSARLRVGGTSAADRNVVVGGTSFPAIDLFTGVADAVIEGNYVGTNAAGTAALNAVTSGIVAVATPGVVIGGTAAGAGNLISGNKTGINIFIAGGGAGPVVQGNRVGTNAAGTAALGNDTGIQLDSITGATVGGAAAGAANVISGNTTGIDFINGTNDNLIQGNFVGTTADGGAPLGNGVGVDLSLNSHDNIVGGLAPGDGNLISANHIGVRAFESRDNVIEGNRIGTNAAGTGPLGNTTDGVQVTADPMETNTTDRTIVGGSVPAAANVIAFNGGAGVAVLSAKSTQTAIRLNSIHDNGGLGIDLSAAAVFADDGVTNNDPNNADGDTGGNDLQNFPVLTSAVSTTANGGSTTVVGNFNSNSFGTYALDFYANDALDPSGSGEGQTYLGSIPVTTDGIGNATFTAVLSAAVPAGKYISATATTTGAAPAGDTSEFSPDVLVSSASPTPTPTPTPTPAPTVSVNDVSATEGNAGYKNFVFTVSLNHTTTAPVTVHFATADGTAGAGTDYVGRNNVLTIPAGQPSGTVTVQVRGDTVAEANETFLLKLSAPTNATIADGTGQGTIVNDDAGLPAVNPGVSVNDVSVTEGNAGTKLLTFTVKLSQATSKAVSVKFTTTDGTAKTTDGDYVGQANTLTFAAGTTTRTVAVVIKGDVKPEPSETLLLVLSQPVNASITDAIGIGTIVNDD